MNLNDAARFVMTRFKTVDGKSFYGTIFAPKDYMPTDNFSYPRRMMRVSSNSIVRPGDSFLTHSGRRYLLAQHSESDTVHLQAHMFQLFELDRSVTWERTDEVVDAVTNLPKGTSKSSLGTIWCSFEAPKTQIDKLNVPKPRYRFVTGTAIQLGDLVDGKRVIQQWDQLGVHFAEIE